MPSSVKSVVCGAMKSVAVLDAASALSIASSALVSSVYLLYSTQVLPTYVSIGLFAPLNHRSP